MHPPATQVPKTTAQLASYSKQHSLQRLLRAPLQEVQPSYLPRGPVSLAPALSTAEHDQINSKMPSSFTLIALAVLPLTILLLPRYIEPYSLLDPIVLNAREEGYEGRQTRWFNMGWWEDTESFPVAAEALATKLLSFAREGGYQGGGNVLDIGHGAGESLLIHLNSISSTPLENLHALTSLSLDTSHSKSLLTSYPDLTRNTKVEFFTSSAEFKEGGSRASDLEHPLNPMRGFLGQRSADAGAGTRGRNQAVFDVDDEDDDEDEGEIKHNHDEVDGRGDHGQSEGGNGGPIRYDLVYILDSIYHYKPSLIQFLSTVKPVLRTKGNSDGDSASDSGSGEGGMIVYTDIIPPSSLPYWKAILISHLMSVPLPNLTQRPTPTPPSGDSGTEAVLEAYKVRLEKEGWVDVSIEDWSSGVWPGFSANLKARGGLWGYVGDIVARAEKDGWMFVAVRAKIGSRR